MLINIFQKLEGGNIGGLCRNMHPISLLLRACVPTGWNLYLLREQIPFFCTSKAHLCFTSSLQQKCMSFIQPEKLVFHLPFQEKFCLQDVSKRIRIIEWLGLEGCLRFCCWNPLTLLLLWRKKISNLFLFIEKWPLKSWWNCVTEMYTLMNLHICMGFVRKEQEYFLLAGITSFSFMEYNGFFQRHEIKSLLPKAALCGSWFNFSWKFCHGLFWKVRCCWGCRATHLFHMNGGKFQDWLMRFPMVF